MIYKYLILTLFIEVTIYEYIYLNDIRKYYFNDEDNANSNSNLNNNVTLVTAYYKIKSKHSYDEYLEWMKNLLKVNRSLVIYGDKSTINITKDFRPKKYHNKTIWIEREMKDFYTFKNFEKEFNDTYKLDIEKFRHTVSLYHVWAEKCKFLEEVVKNNYFNTKCFYWVDIGYFRNPKLAKNYTNWPSTNKCLKDPRVIFNHMRKFYSKEIIFFKRLNINYYRIFMRKYNVAGNIFGGQAEYIKNFSNIYYNTIKLFAKNKMFIGKDQNLFAYIALLNPKLVKLVYSRNWGYFYDYLK